MDALAAEASEIVQASGAFAMDLEQMERASNAERNALEGSRSRTTPRNPCYSATAPDGRSRRVKK